jgi:hypothetical protein
MIPRTYPSTLASDGITRQMVVYFLSSISGLQRWVDYIPVAWASGSVVNNSYNTSGATAVEVISSTTGRQSWVDYVPVYLDASASGAWEVSLTGYIPINGGVASLFTAGEQGAWYDPSDLSTMYQDSAGTTPVTAVGQPVGLMLDKRLGAVRGSNVASAAYVTPPSFDNVTTSLSATSFSQTGGTTASRSALVLSTTAGRWYEVEYTLSSVSSGTMQAVARDGNSPGVGTALTTGSSVSAGGAGRLIFQAITASSNILWVNNSTGSSATVTGISIKDLQGNHRTQSTAASRPTLSGRYNLLEKSDQFDDVYWTKSGLNITAGADGTADKWVPTTANASHIIQRFVAVTAGVSYKLSVKAKKDGYRYFYFGHTGAASIFDFDTGTFGTTAGTATYSAAQQADGYWLLTETFTAAGASITVEGASQPVSTFTTFAGDGSSGALVKDADLRLSADASLAIPAYQRVNTATDYDTTGFPLYLSYDGVDDWMSTASVDFSATDKMTVWAGVHKASDAAPGIFVELSAVTSNPGSFGLQAPNSAVNSYRFESGGSAPGLIADAVGFAAPVGSVVTGVGSISGDVSQIRVNGVARSTNNNDQGTGNYGNYPIYFGRRGGTTLPFNGREYQTIIRGAATSAAQLSSIEQFVASKVGVSF